MTDNVENIVLEQLRHIRNDLKTHSTETKEQLAWIRQLLSSVEHSTALIHADLGALHGDIAGINLRLVAFEKRFDRLENRLNLMDE